MSRISSAFLSLSVSPVTLPSTHACTFGRIHVKAEAEANTGQRALHHTVILLIADYRVSFLHPAHRYKISRSEVFSLHAKLVTFLLHYCLMRLTCIVRLSFCLSYALLICLFTSSHFFFFVSSFFSSSLPSHRVSSFRYTLTHTHGDFSLHRALVHFLRLSYLPSPIMVTSKSTVHSCLSHFRLCSLCSSLFNLQSSLLTSDFR